MAPHTAEAGDGIQARLVPREERKLQDIGFAGCFGVFLVGVFALGFNAVANASSVGASSRRRFCVCALRLTG